MKFNLGDIAEILGKYGKLKSRIEYYLDILEKESEMLKSPEIKKVHDEVKEIVDSLP